MQKVNKLSKMPLHVSIHLRYLYQDKGLKGKELLKKYPMYSKATIYRHARKPINNKDDGAQKNTFKKRGRPSKLTTREKRSILREIPKLRESVGSFTTKRLRAAAGVQTTVCDETIRRFLHSSGYHYFHSRKKGLLTQKDLRLRLKFARKAKKLPVEEKLWTEGIAFYLDGVGFQDKYNPFDEARSTKTMAWRKRDEGLKPNCTAKGSHVGSGGKVAHFMVAIAYMKGVILCEQYEGRVNGEMFANFIYKHFESTFERSANPAGKLFLQDGDPSQNSKKAKIALDAVGARKFSIPPRSPDMNPIENVFNFAKDTLHQQALDQNITFENMEQYSAQVKHTLENISIAYLNKTINSMDKRTTLVTKSGGKCRRY